MLFVAAVFLFISCKQKPNNRQFVRDDKIQKEIQEKFILVEDGGTIELPEGKNIVYLIDFTLSYYTQLIPSKQLFFLLFEKPRIGIDSQKSC